MTLAFEAKCVDCADAIDGEILQLSFDTVPEGYDEEERRTPNFRISRDFEFPDPATVEWHDGRDYDGGAEILSGTLSRGRISTSFGWASPPAGPKIRRMFENIKEQLTAVGQKLSHLRRFL